MNKLKFFIDVIDKVITVARLIREELKKKEVEE